MKIIERLDQYIEYKKINDNQITVNCGLSQGLLAKARTGKSDLGKKAIEKILNYYQDLSYPWLLTGEGVMVKKEDQAIYQDSPGVNANKTDSFLTADLVNSISTMIQTNERNSISLANMVDTAKQDSNTIARLVDILYKNGIDMPDQSKKRGGLSENANESPSPSQKNRNKNAG